MLQEYQNGRIYGTSRTCCSENGIAKRRQFCGYSFSENYCLLRSNNALTVVSAHGYRSAVEARNHNEWFEIVQVQRS